MSLLEMREKGLADNHFRRQFMPDRTKRLDGSTGDADIYGVDDGVILASQVPLAIMQLSLPASRTWTLQRGWIEHVEVEGTGPIETPPGGTIVLVTQVGYAYYSIPAFGSTFVHNTTGDYQIQSAAILIFPAGVSLPFDNVVQPNASAAASGYYTTTRYRTLYVLNAEGAPLSTFTSGWRQIGPNLEF